MHSSGSRGLTIGQLARSAGVTIDTLRYYEREGLLEPPPRAKNNYRRYPERAVATVRFIRRARELGFGLDAVRELCRVRARGVACDEARTIATRRLDELEREVAALQRSAAWLRALVDRCNAADPAFACPILVAIEDSR